MKNNNMYYHFEDDLKEYPDAWCFIVWSARGKGKTYSGLKYSYENKIPIVYMKRTIEDVNLICSANAYGFDPSPYVPINRDHHYNIKAQGIENGIAGFWNFNEFFKTPQKRLAFLCENGYNNHTLSQRVIRYLFYLIPHYIIHHF